MSDAWSKPVRLHELSRGPIALELEPDADQRAAIARQLRIKSLPRLTARVRLRPWLDGAEITGAIEAVVEQVCSLTLEPFEQALSGQIAVQAVPAGSPHAPSEENEADYDPEAPDPPDVLESDIIDVAAYVVEHLALEVDPFPRKPGATFDFTPPEPEESPFAALKALKDPKP